MSRLVTRQVVLVEVVVRPRHTANTRGAVHSDCFRRLETAARSDSNAGVQRVETEQSSHITIGSLLNSRFEGACPD